MASGSEPRRRAVRRRPVVPAADRARGLLIVHTGDGKGKTTAALGTMLRAWGHGMRVACYQFIKSFDRKYGEHRAAERLGWEMTPLGDGFTWLSKDIEKDKALARACWERCRAALADPGIDLLVLDEITYPMTYGWLDTGEVLAAIRARPARMHVICTGRDAPAALVEAADTVTEMRPVKHAYDKGIPAKRGIEL